MESKIKVSFPTHPQISILTGAPTWTDSPCARLTRRCKDRGGPRWLPQGPLTPFPCLPARTTSCPQQYPKAPASSGANPSSSHLMPPTGSPVTGQHSLQLCSPLRFPSHHCSLKILSTLCSEIPTPPVLKRGLGKFPGH